MSFKLLLATLVLLFPIDDSQDESEMDYVVYEEGPRTVYEGKAKLYYDENTTACINYTFDLVPGRLAGPSISSDPGQPMLPFDNVRISDTHIFINWEESRTDLQDNPVECHRRFIFYMIKTEFNGDDLGKLLADWGPPITIDHGTQVSPWDLNGDTIVNGVDLAILLGGWKVN